MQGSLTFGIFGAVCVYVEMTAGAIFSTGALAYLEAAAVAIGVSTLSFVGIAIAAAVIVGVLIALAVCFCQNKAKVKPSGGRGDGKKATVNIFNDRNSIGKSIVIVGLFSQ